MRLPKQKKPTLRSVAHQMPILLTGRRTKPQNALLPLQGDFADCPQKVHYARIRCAAPDLKENQSDGEACWVKSALFSTASRISD
jgi:hypothetical protein